MIHSYMVRIYARDLRPGMLIVESKRDLMVESVEEGPCGRGMHVNVVRRPAFIKRNGKHLANPEAGLIVHCDGCFDKGMLITVRIIDREDVA